MSNFLTLLKIGLDSILVYCRIQHDKVIISIFILCVLSCCFESPSFQCRSSPPGGVFSNEEARLLSSSCGNNHGVSASFENAYRTEKTHFKHVLRRICQGKCCFDPFMTRKIFSGPPCFEKIIVQVGNGPPPHHFSNGPSLNIDYH
jgi:hypothetical protein